MQINIITNEGEKSITVYHPDRVEPYSARGDHPKWNEIVAGVTSGDESVLDLFDLGRAIQKEFEYLTERVSLYNGEIYFDGDVLHNALTKHIIRHIESEDDFGPLVEFFEKIQLNPQQHSRDQLFEWLDHHEFTITDAGDIVGYKGVNRSDAHDYVSVHAGTAVVDGIEYNGQIPNYIDATVEMPRSVVDHNPSQGCSVGLHVADYDFASDWGEVVLKVLINPRDVVSVPTETNWAKVRCCRYYVDDVVEEKIQAPVVPVNISRNRTPNIQQYAEMATLAKSRKKGFEAQAKAKGWDLVGSDITNRADWILPDGN